MNTHKLNWQLIHESLLEDLNTLAGRPVQDFERYTRHLRGPALWAARFLNDLNTLACDNYQKESYEEARRDHHTL